MEFYEWIEFHNEIWVYLNGMITIFLTVTRLDKWILSLVQKWMGLS